ncbi:hypothetical protein [Novosphingopyxis sp. YJ-S2-01]|uniref:hypothetical protein n=1 Tax=Novosphingopyxis sp. YJ-S2-01 TaxID=2794021 RepID=UPI0018DD9FBC|nr:hypothetical protein [Novosphingopyxis sp. YJ-S2-01]MBH9537550.1 hypothetical protein [Novosphingopyxis sp. YJ-S2-01]
MAAFIAWYLATGFGCVLMTGAPRSKGEVLGATLVNLLWPFVMAWALFDIVRARLSPTPSDSDQ